jgi:hypothetical protein
VLASYFHDAQCQEVALAAHPTASPRIAVHHTAATNCTRYLAVGAEVTEPTLYVQLGGACVEVAPPGGARIYAAGAPVPVASWQRTREVLPDRRLQRVLLAHDAVRLDDELLHDGELAADCRRTVLADGHVRCLPAHPAPVEVWFADAACTELVELAMVPSGSCDTPTAFARQGDAIHAVLAPWTAPLYELEPGDRCGDYTPPARFVPHVIGPALPLEAFVAATPPGPDTLPP